MATTDPDTQAGSSTVPDEAHYMRITSHGQIRTWVEFALDFFKVRAPPPACARTAPV
jgi:hypothetical protein